MKLRFLVRGLVFGALFALPVSADAPPGQYAQFATGDRRITDAKTRLRWERAVSASPVTFANAKTFCAEPLRLPTFKELLTLVDEAPHQDYDNDLLQNVDKTIDQQAFGNDYTPVNAAYWTSSMSGAQVFTVNFGDGTSGLTSQGDSRYVRCVEALP